MAKQKLIADWNEVDPSTLSPALKARYDAYKAQYAKAKEERAKFEADMQVAAGLPATHKLAFGYNFGKLSLAVVPNVATKAGSKAVAFASIKVAA